MNSMNPPRGILTRTPRKTGGSFAHFLYAR